ncbi:MAG: hypothetical protein QG610_2308, partial [Euryarchaeota archaeon]|nr:hypothetical protein [Euryarchaeota archaeon]
FISATLDAKSEVDIVFGVSVNDTSEFRDLRSTEQKSIFEVMEE